MFRSCDWRWLFGHVTGVGCLRIIMNNEMCLGHVTGVGCLNNKKVFRSCDWRWLVENN